MEAPISEQLAASCRIGEVEEISKILSTHPELLNVTDNKLGWSPLYRTVICGHMSATEFLLAKGANPDLADTNGKSPLHQAVENSQIKLLKLLLLYKANPNLLQLDGDSAIHQASLKGESKIVNLLISNGANVNILNPLTGKSPLHLAVENSQFQTAKLLLKHNANNFSKDFSGKVPSDYAKNDLKSLFSKSARTDSEKSTHNSPLFLASSDTVELIPSIPLDSFSDWKLSPMSTKSFKVLEKVPIEPDAERSQMEIRVSKTYSFGGSALLHWLESVNLECLYECLMKGGYDDIDQMISQMMTAMPITEEILENIGVKKPGYRKRLLAALDEEINPLRSKRTHRHNHSTPIQCCVVSTSNTSAFLSVPNLSDWLSSLHLSFLYENFFRSGYDDIEHLFTLMNSKWPITEKVLKNDLGIEKQAHRYKLLAALKTESNGFTSMKKGNLTNRYHNDDMVYEKTACNVACGSCEIN